MGTSCNPCLLKRGARGERCRTGEKKCHLHRKLQPCCVTARPGVVQDLKANICAWTRRARVSWWSAWCPADSRVPITGFLLLPRHNSPPSSLLAHAVGNEGSSLLRFCFVEGVRRATCTHSAHTWLTCAEAAHTYVQQGSALHKHQQHLQLLAVSLLLIDLKTLSLGLGEFNEVYKV